MACCIMKPVQVRLCKQRVQPRRGRSTCEFLPQLRRSVPTQQWGCAHPGDRVAFAPILFSAFGPWPSFAERLLTASLNSGSEDGPFSPPPPSSSDIHY